MVSSMGDQSSQEKIGSSEVYEVAHKINKQVKDYEEVTGSKKIKKGDNWRTRYAEKQHDSEMEKEKEAMIDPLTGLFNRRAFKKVALEIIEEAKRRNEKVSIVMLDMDNFKDVNDTYGHNVGDLVLIKIAEMIKGGNTDHKSGVRKADVSGRWGGEEFVLLLPNTDLDKASDIAERLRQFIEKTLIVSSNESEIRSTVSLGVATLGKKEELEKCIDRADKAMYDAKEKVEIRWCRGHQN